jgi:hypothetical protein
MKLVQDGHKDGKKKTVAEPLLHNCTERSELIKE